MLGTTFCPAQTGQPVRPFITEWTTLRTRASNSCPQSWQTNTAFLLLVAATSLGVKVFLPLHIAAALGHWLAKSLMPEEVLSDHVYYYDHVNNRVSYS